MARSAHDFIRGSTAQFYALLGALEPGLVPRGPSVWIGGDCHVSNLGPLGGTHDEVEFQIRDHDQAVVGNPAHDLVRLGLSLAMSAWSADVSGMTIGPMLDELLQGYGETLV